MIKMIKSKSEKHRMRVFFYGLFSWLIIYITISLVEFCVFLFSGKNMNFDSSSSILIMFFILVFVYPKIGFIENMILGKDIHKKLKVWYEE